ncbi:MAG: ABC transporter permease [Firmicutes bacterium]|nr:ABC transporter permease [Bacillota bacterium]
MVAYALRKLIFTCIVLLGAATCSFILLHLIPGDTAEALAGPQASVEDVENLRRSLGLDRPLSEQYFIYLSNLAKGNLGSSYRTKRTVAEEIAARWPATLMLSCTSLLVAVVIGIPIGVYAAIKRGSFLDTISMIAAFIGVSMPSFWLGLILIVVFSIKLGLFPYYGRESLLSYVLPSLTLGLAVAANIARLTRASMLDVLNQDYIRTARGKGLKESRVILVHALRNASIPIVTIIGLQWGFLLGGQVVTETVFSWPGIGRMIVDALLTRDLQIVQGGILVMALTFTVLNLLTDISYAILDPRIRL